MTALTADHDEGFYDDLRAVAQFLRARPEHMAAVMYSESGVFAHAHNEDGDASGLIQFLPSTLARLRWTQGDDAFRRLTARQQLPFVQRYYQPYVGHLSSIAGLYVATFMPVHIKNAHDPNFILTAKGGPYGWAYAANASLDANGDLAITVDELEAAVRRNARGARWWEILARLDASDGVVDLGSILGVQRALTALAFQPGPLDGIWGSRTRAAVVAFQRSASVQAGGIVGPITRRALAIALAQNLAP